jgi:uncharacterized protein
MAQEVLLSPGVLLNENDQSQITLGTVTAGLSLVGPTVKGQPNIPILVTSYSDFKSKYGDAFVSASNTYEYLTSIAAYNYFQQGGQSILVTRVVTGSYTSATTTSGTKISGSAGVTETFVLETLSQGTIMNNAGSTGSNGTLVSGSANNVRWEIQSPNTSSGVFTVVIRQGDDTATNPSVLETWPNVSLDPNAANFVSRVIGDKSRTVGYDSTTGNYYIQESGSYNNASAYVRVKSVLTPTPNYFNNDGTFKSQYTASIPVAASGSFGGATGREASEIPANLFENINSSNTQGLSATAYTIAVNLLANSENYDFTLLSAPGITQVDYSSTVSSFITLAQNRGDCFYITDLVGYNATVGSVVNQAASLNTNYAAAYWPWVQVLSQASGKLVWVPASTIMPGVYAFNDRVAAEWFAPAGLNRGGLGGVLQAERKLAVGDRDSLYVGKVNPIASFPGVGLVAYGQKTLQTQASALDRVNVRRLLIALKRYIGNIAETLLFEQNTIATRNNFLSQVNPYLEAVQQRQGLYAYRVVMDDTNNTSDVIDRNQLVGQIYIQPTKTIEYIQLTFNITPTGVNFGA